MRIISGDFKSRRFNFKLPSGIRPTTDMAKETLFNIIDNLVNIEGIKVLDLYAGSGSIGIEFLSRGAELVHFNDKNYNSIKYIGNILKELNVDNYLISKQNSSSLLNNLQHKYDIIFIDPPYNSDEYEKTLKIIKDLDLINQGAIVIVESDEFKHIDFEYNLIKEKKISSSVFRFYGNL